MQTNPLIRQRWFYAGFGLAGLGSFGLMSFPLIVQLPLMQRPEAVVIFVFGLAILMATGGVLAVFNLRTR